MTSQHRDIPQHKTGSIASNSAITRFEEFYNPSTQYMNVTRNGTHVPCWVGQDEVVMIAPDTATHIFDTPVYCWDTEPTNIEVNDTGRKITLSARGREQVLDTGYLTKLGHCFGWTREEAATHLRHAYPGYLTAERPLMFNEDGLFGIIAPILPEEEE